MSLRLRLLMATAVAVLCGLVVVDVVTYVVVGGSQVQQVDDALERAHPPLEVLAGQGPGSWDAIPAIVPGLFVAIVDGDGELVFSSAGREPGESPIEVDVSAVPLRRGDVSVESVDGDEVRLRVDTVADGSTLIVGQSLHEVNETRSKLLVVLVTASVAAIVLVVALAWWLVRAGLAPLRRVEASAAEITDSDLEDHRVPGAEGRTEVAHLARALNSMLDRLDTARAERERTLAELEASEARMRRFVADASHELRTPLAATAAYAELFEHGARDRPDDLDRSMAGIRTETARMTDLVDDLLLLARLDEQRPVATGEVDLTDVVFASVDAARAIEPGRPIRLRVDEVVTVRGDASRLRQVVDNLLANVRAHTTPSTACEVALTIDGQDAVLVVSDVGQGVVEDQLEHLFDRFYRVDVGRSRANGGSGLGLSIVDAIVRSHGGTIEATANDPTGLALTIRLPVLASAAASPSP